MAEVVAEKTEGTGAVKGGVGGVLGTLAVVGMLAGAGVIQVGEEDIAAKDGVVIRANDTKTELVITETTGEIDELKAEEVAVKKDITASKRVSAVDGEGKPFEYDSLYKTGQVKDTVQTRHPRIPLHVDNEATTGQTFQCIYMLDSVVIGHVAYTVPVLPQGQICKLVSTNDFTTDLPAVKR
jgi:hypothetical protein